MVGAFESCFFLRVVYWLHETVYHGAEQNDSEKLARKLALVRIGLIKFWMRRLLLINMIFFPWSCYASSRPHHCRRLSCMSFYAWSPCYTVTESHAKLRTLQRHPFAVGKHRTILIVEDQIHGEKHYGEKRSIILVIMGWSSWKENCHGF